MSEKHTKGEMHGCIVCGKLYQLYVVSDAQGKFIDCKVMTSGGRCVPDPHRPLVACEKHTDEDVKAAVIRAYDHREEEDE